MTRQLLRDSCELAARILDGEYDTDLDYIEQAARARAKRVAAESGIRVGARVRLINTRNPELEGAEGVVVKRNPKTYVVGLGERDQFGYPREFNVPRQLLEAV